MRENEAQPDTRNLRCHELNPPFSTGRPHPFPISVDTKIVSKVLELLLFPMFAEFAEEAPPEAGAVPAAEFLSRPDIYSGGAGGNSRWTSRALTG